MKKIILLFSVIVCCSTLIVFCSPGMPVPKDPVKNIVLVHGAFADGSGFQALYELLKKKGFHVSVVGNPNTGFKDDVDAVHRVIARQDGPVLL
ncbi:MAG: alpha/beta hydrolase, partial [Chitinophagaceae bacterium]